MLDLPLGALADRASRRLCLVGSAAAILGQRAAGGLMTTVPASGLGAMAAVSGPAGALLT